VIRSGIIIPREKCDGSWDMDEGVYPIQEGHGGQMTIQEELLEVDLSDEEDKTQPGLMLDIQD